MEYPGKCDIDGRREKTIMWKKEKSRRRDKVGYKGEKHEGQIRMMEEGLREWLRGRLLIGSWGRLVKECCASVRLFLYVSP